MRRGCRGIKWRPGDGHSPGAPDRPVFPATSRETHYSPAASPLLPVPRSRPPSRSHSSPHILAGLFLPHTRTLLPGNSNSCRGLTFNKEIRWPRVFTPRGMCFAGKRRSSLCVWCMCVWRGVAGGAGTQHRSPRNAPTCWVPN